MEHKEALALEMIHDMGKMANLKSSVIKEILDTDDIEMVEWTSQVIGLYKACCTEQGY